MPHLDSIILDTVEDRILSPERIHILLEKLIARRAAFAGNVDSRPITLRAERTKIESAINNLYRLAETGNLGIDESLSARIQELRAQKSKIEATIVRAETQAAPVAQFHTETVETFSQTLKEKLRHADPVLRRNYLRSVVGRVIVGEKQVVVVGSTHSLYRSIAEGTFSANSVRSFVQERRAIIYN